MPHVEVPRAWYDDPHRVVEMDTEAWGRARVIGFMADLRALPCDHGYDRAVKGWGEGYIWKIWIADADAALALKLRWG